MLPCSGRDSAMTNLQSGSFWSAEGRIMPASLHFKYSMAVRRSPMPSWFTTKPSSTSSLLCKRTNSHHNAYEIGKETEYYSTTVYMLNCFSPINEKPLETKELLIPPHHLVGCLPGTGIGYMIEMSDWTRSVFF